MLSLGEQQRLGMVVFEYPSTGGLQYFACKHISVIYEVITRVSLANSATSVDVEESLYKRAQALGIAVVTISQRPALIPYHSMELRLIDGEGGWEVRSIRHN
ncbi:unnamed protein product [Sphagnum jensenii]|uniref:Uncharacterized protein n=2 Tax=Sphagnum jensenii TaxID=128206 RepID=A0ABP0X4F8_9BRYO